MGAAIDDARSKLIDEGWFGRRTMPGIGNDALADERMPTAVEPAQSFDAMWAPYEPGDPRLEGDRGRDGLDIER